MIKELAGRANDDRGAVTVWVILMMVLVMLVAGLVLDGGRRIMAGREAVAVAEEAARAGAGQLNDREIYAGAAPRVDPAHAAAAARSYLARTGRSGTVQVTGARTFKVSVRISTSTWMLSLVGIGTMTATGTATSHLVPAVEGESR